MAWERTLLECSFRGVVFDVVSTRDRVERATSTAEYPYLDGGDVTDLGARSPRFSLQAIWFGDDYEDRLRSALNAFNEPGVGELIHPVWGSIAKVQFVSADLEHAATEPDSCSVTLEFIESRNETQFWVSGAAEAQEAIGAPGDEALAESENSLVDAVGAVQAANPLSMLSDLRQTMLGPILAFTAEVNGVLLSGLDVLDEPRAWARDIAALSNGVLAAADFPNRLMAEWRNITGVFDRIAEQWSGDAPVAGYTPWTRGSAPTESQAQAVVRAHLAVSNATAQADAAAIVLASEATEPTLSPVEIETVANGARDVIESTINQVRVTYGIEQSVAIVNPLKDQAWQIQQAAQSIIEARPPLLAHTLTSPGNLRLIAHRLYGDHTRAVELLRLNNPVNPNALAKGDTLYAYAR